MSTSLTTAPKPFCFVLMPFSEAFDDVYQIGIKEACQNAGAYCERVDEQIFHGSILERIFNQIAKADLLIADMTGRNENVFYEVGYAHALARPTILLTQTAVDIPFDLKQFPHIIYGAKLSLLRDELQKRVAFFIANPPRNLSQTKVGLELFLRTHRLDSDVCWEDCEPNQSPAFELVLRNSSGLRLQKGDFRIAIVTDSRMSMGSTQDSKRIELPEGRMLHTLPDFEALLPEEYVSAWFEMWASPPLKAGEEVQTMVRLFTRSGTSDFPVSFRQRGLDWKVPTS